MVPAFHAACFASTAQSRAIVNIGGIANITLLPKNSDLPILGFDTGPGNTLLDLWAEKHLHQPHDYQGNWARNGKVLPALFSAAISDPFFKLSAPKSTGRDYFNLNWLKPFLTADMNPIDIQTTLVELTAYTIIEAVHQYLSAGELFICGGGVHNLFLLERLTALAEPHYQIHSTLALGIDPDWVEAMAFAWLAKQTLHRKPGNLTAVTGAAQPSILGGVYFA